MLHVSEIPCPPPAAQKNGHRGNCPEPFFYKGQCQFECDDGYMLPPGGTFLINCITKFTAGIVSVEWDKSPEACTGILAIDNAPNTLTTVGYTRH